MSTRSSIASSSVVGATGRRTATIVTPERQLAKAAEQIQTTLRRALHTAEMDALASYYTLVEPQVDGGVPFCVALARRTFLFHLQMERVADADVQPYIYLITKVCSLLGSAALHHPFVADTLRCDVFGLPPSTRRGSRTSTTTTQQHQHFAHSVALLPPAYYRGFCYLATELAVNASVPTDIITAWRQQLEGLVNARSPLVSLRAQSLLVCTSPTPDARSDLAELQRIVQSRPRSMRVDLILLCYARLRRLVPDATNCSPHGRALALICSGIFLRFNSPIRRHYLEAYLFPVLSTPDPQTEAFLNDESIRRHTVTSLLRHCTSGMVPQRNHFYACLVAILGPDLADDLSGALELVTLMEYQMPHASHFIAALAVDPNCNHERFTKMIMSLVRGAAHIMARRDPQTNEVAAAVNNRSGMVYNILYTVRAIVRQCCVTDSKHAQEVLRYLRGALQPTTVTSLGSFAAQAFEGRCNINIEPQLLCSELGMMLHGHGVDEAVEACLAYFTDSASRCPTCHALRSTSLLCPMNSTLHINDAAALSRVLGTVADCASLPQVQNKLIALLRSPTTQMTSAVHYLLYYIIAHSGQYRAELLNVLNPYLRNLLVTLLDADAQGVVSSEAKGSVLVFHARLVPLLPQDALQLQSTLKVLGQLHLRCEHDALVLWHVAHRLLRIGHRNVELMPLDPAENNYGNENAAVAPSCFAAADNAQLLLHLLVRVHGFNAATRKLTGPSVCRLVQDFNMQAPNIIGSLLDPVGFVSNTAPAAADFAIPTSAQSVFWSFVIRQIKRSAPARNALIVAAGRCYAQRFRFETPATAVTADGVDPTNHVFAVALSCILQQHVVLARVFAAVLTEWVRQPNHPAGKYTCLAYFTVQILRVLEESRKERLAKYHSMQQHGGQTQYTSQTALKQAQAQRQAVKAEAQVLQESIASIAAVLKSRCVPELASLMPLVRENPAFYALVGHVGKAVQSAVRASTGHRDSGKRQKRHSVGEMSEDDHIFDVAEQYEDNATAAFQQQAAEYQQYMEQRHAALMNANGAAYQTVDGDVGIAAAGVPMPQGPYGAMMPEMTVDRLVNGDDDGCLDADGDYGNDGPDGDDYYDDDYNNTSYAHQQGEFQYASAQRQERLEQQQQQQQRQHESSYHSQSSGYSSGHPYYATQDEQDGMTQSSQGSMNDRRTTGVQTNTTGTTVTSSVTLLSTASSAPAPQSIIKPLAGLQVQPPNEITVVLPEQEEHVRDEASQTSPHNDYHDNNEDENNNINISANASRTVSSHSTASRRVQTEKSHTQRTQQSDVVAVEGVADTSLPHLQAALSPSSLRQQQQQYYNGGVNYFVSDFTTPCPLDKAEMLLNPNINDQDSAKRDIEKIKAMFDAAAESTQWPDVGPAHYPQGAQPPLQYPPPRLRGEDAEIAQYYQDASDPPVVPYYYMTNEQYQYNGTLQVPSGYYQHPPNHYHAPHSDYVELPRQVVLAATVPAHSNNYNEPHKTQQDPQAGAVLAPFTALVQPPNPLRGNNTNTTTTTSSSNNSQSGKPLAERTAQQDNADNVSRGSSSRSSPRTKRLREDKGDENNKNNNNGSGSVLGYSGPRPRRQPGAGVSPHASLTRQPPAPQWMAQQGVDSALYELQGIKAQMSSGAGQGHGYDDHHQYHNSQPQQYPSEHHAHYQRQTVPPPPSHIQQALVERQSAQEAIAEVRQVLGYAHPNTAHGRNGQRRKVGDEAVYAPGAIIQGTQQRYVPQYEIGEQYRIGL